MCSRHFVAMILFVMSSICTAHSQTSDIPKKKCDPPKATYSPSSTYFYDRGVAIISILVDEKGLVQDPQLVQSSGSKGYDKDWMKTVRKWRFQPALCDGKPSPMRFNIEFQATAMRQTPASRF
jgi:TonB family protein